MERALAQDCPPFQLFIMSATSEHQAYDQNFCFPVPEALESDRVKLVPFVPSLHSKAYADLSSTYREVYRYIPLGAFWDQAALDTYIEQSFRVEPGWILFAVFDKTKPSETFGSRRIPCRHYRVHQHLTPKHLSTEIGAVILFPPFQRTHVASNATGLLLQYALNRPNALQWRANALNKGSINLAQRLKFQMEGVLRWNRALPAHLANDQDRMANRESLREEDPKPDCVGRDTALLGLCWDDWESGAKENVATVMARTK
ncbi:hypothetical protein DFP72DRAFT_902992 [Ephemerocybe angulata]|uniref:N-acetyltransferase domain-containing protein n=1 Tax=Ephemerocybe angulata TaxID=980116 RepID=A0A8H6M3A3_9AGAR|nr:hypothetical protein DFP72DRAFT_902992 [Tulosesus angulatus]